MGEKGLLQWGFLLKIASMSRCVAVVATLLAQAIITAKAIRKNDEKGWFYLRYQLLCIVTHNVRSPSIDERVRGASRGWSVGILNHRLSIQATVDHRSLQPGIDFGS